MLDQNTDRMWYVIGAVIVGAALIFLMNGTFPTLFANIGETFEEKVGETTEMTDGIMPKVKSTVVLTPDMLQTRNAEDSTYDATTKTWTIDVVSSTDGFSSGLSIRPGKLVVPYGKTVTIRYDIYLPDDVGKLVASNDINNRPANAALSTWAGNDNDFVSSRVYKNVQKGSVSAIPLQSGQWTTVEYSSINAHPLNVDRVALSYDYSSFGVFNNTGRTIQVQIKNATVTIN